VRRVLPRLAQQMNKDQEVKADHMRAVLEGRRHMLSVNDSTWEARADNIGLFPTCCGLWLPWEMQALPGHHIGALCVACMPEWSRALGAK
jgi:hypothetical protein